MNQIEMERLEARRLSAGNVVGVLLEQHAQIRELCETVGKSTGSVRQAAFDELRALLAVHEAGEQEVLRPVSRQVLGEKVPAAHSEEEREIERLLVELELLDPAGDRFAQRFARFAGVLAEHVVSEEDEEFPAVRAGRPDADLDEMGVRLLAGRLELAEWPVGTFAVLLDRARTVYRV